MGNLLPSIGWHEKKTVLVTGASGLLGRAVLKEILELKQFRVVGTAHTRPSGNLFKINLMDQEAVQTFLHDQSPLFIINCAAERRPDICEGNAERTKKLNVELPKLLAEYTAQSGGWLLHISTDYVFDGSAPPYLPDSATNPLNAYGSSKLEAELAIKVICKSYGILRVPVLYGPTLDFNESAVTSLLKDVKSGIAQTVDNWGIRYPTDVTEVAVVIRQILCKRLEDDQFEGIWHWSTNQVQENGQPFTKYQLCLLMGEVLGLNRSHLKPDDKVPKGAPRPKDCHLDSTFLRQLQFGKQPETSLRENFSEILRPFV